MLEAAIVLQLALGERVEAMVIAVVLVLNAALGFFQEGRAQATLDALKSRLALNASVLRDGVWRTVPVAELAPGDVVKLSLGGVVGADVRLLDGEVLLDQSTLIGESLPIEAGPGVDTYAGALVRRGEAIAEVTATGPRTCFGRTAELVRTAHVVSGQQKAVLGLVRNLAMFNGVIVVVQVIYALALGMTPTEIVPLTLTAILAAIPVALPATFTLASALGARALAAVTLVFGGQAVLYVVRERRRLWSSRPSLWLIASSVADVSIVAPRAALEGGAPAGGDAAGLRPRRRKGRGVPSVADGLARRVHRPCLGRPYCALVASGAVIATGWSVLPACSVSTISAAVFGRPQGTEAQARSWK